MPKHRLIASLLVLTIAACSQDPGAPNMPGDGSGQLSLLNGLSGGDATALRLDGAAISLPASGHSATTSISEGAHQLQAVEGSQVTATATFTMADGKHRTAVLSGFAGHTVLLVTTLDTAAVPVTDAAKMRVVHSAPDAPAMDAYLFEVGHAADSASRFISNFQYGAGTDPRFPGYALRPPGQYLVWLKAAGTDQVLVQAGPFTMNGGDVTSFVLSETTGGSLELRAVKER